MLSLPAEPWGVPWELGAAFLTRQRTRRPIDDHGRRRAAARAPVSYVERLYGVLTHRKLRSVARLPPGIQKQRRPELTVSFVRQTSGEKLRGANKHVWGVFVLYVTPLGSKVGRQVTEVYCPPILGIIPGTSARSTSC